MPSYTVEFCVEVHEADDAQHAANIARDVLLAGPWVADVYPDSVNEDPEYCVECTPGDGATFGPLLDVATSILARLDVEHRERQALGLPPGFPCAALRDSLRQALQQAGATLP